VRALRVFAVGVGIFCWTIRDVSCATFEKQSVKYKETCRVIQRLQWIDPYHARSRTGGCVSMRAAAGKQSQLSSLQEVHPGRKLFTLCDHFGELHWIKRGEKIDDFFGIEDSPSPVL
jgi:hypothetical protein